MEVVILPEMETAGEEAIQEARDEGLDDKQQAIRAYMAMRAVYCMAVIADASKEIH